MERGFVKVWRKTLDSELLQHPRALQLFMHLLLTATSKPCRRIVAGGPVELRPGDVVTGRERLAQELGATVREIRTAMDILKKMEIVTTKATNKYSIISIINWDRYQQQRPAERPAKQPAEWPASDQQATTEQEVKNINTPLDTSLRSVSIPQGGATEKQSRPRFIPPTVGEVRDYCESRGNSIDPQAFVDFYESNGWKVGKNQMKDWRAAVRTWEAKRKESPRPEPRRMNKAEELAAHNRAVCQEVYEMFTGMQAEQGVFDL
jgi:hypothetical protein